MKKEHDSVEHDQAAADEKPQWHKPVCTELDFDRTALTAVGGPCDAGCCCCSYTPTS